MQAKLIDYKNMSYEEYSLSNGNLLISLFNKLDVGNCFQLIGDNLIMDFNRTNAGYYVIVTNKDIPDKNLISADGEEFSNYEAIKILLYFFHYQALYPHYSWVQISDEDE